MAEPGEKNAAESDASAGEDFSCDWRPQAEIAFNVAQARDLKDMAARGGLRFEAFLAPAQAVWFLGLIEKRAFGDPGEALAAILGEQQDLEPHADLRKEILNRSLDAALNNPGPPVPLEDVFCSVRAKMEGPQPEPAIWKVWPGADVSSSEKELPVDPEASDEKPI